MASEATPVALVTGAGVPGQPAVRHLIRVGNLRVTVEKVEDARARLERVVGAVGAQIVRSEMHEDRVEYLLRVPAPTLDAAMDSLAALGKVERRSLSLHDVTDQIIDAEARLATLRASRDRLRQLIERSSSVSDVVAVERELGRVQAELESLEGRLAAVQGRVTMSELTVRLDQRVILGPLGLLGAGIGKVIEKLFVWR